MEFLLLLDYGKKRPRFFSWVLTMPERLLSFTCWKMRFCKFAFWFFVSSVFFFPLLFYLYGLLNRGSLLQRLVQHQPTQHPTSEELSIGKIKFKAFDLGGHQIARRVWKDYYAKVVIVFWFVNASYLLITFNMLSLMFLMHLWLDYLGYILA